MAGSSQATERNAVLSALMLALVVSLTTTAATSVQDLQATQTDPPFHGSIFVDSDIVRPSDPTVFESVSFTGRGSRTVFDRRVDDWITINAYLFVLVFSDGLASEVVVNPEFGSESAAQAQAETFGKRMGLLPYVLRTNVSEVWIHKGEERFGGGSDSILIHTGQADSHIDDGILEETLIHETTHASLDAEYEDTPDWKAAQEADGRFITSYAKEFPDREDLAESFLLYLAVRYRSGRISPHVKSTIEETIPNRIAFFDARDFNVSPMDETSRTGSDSDGDGVPDDDDLCPNFPGEPEADGC